MLVYFWVLSDYGFKFKNTFFMNQLKGYFPLDTDIYNPNVPNFGNSNFGKPDEFNFIDWGLSY